MIPVATRAKLLVVGIFCVGALTGALVDSVYEKRWSAEADSSAANRSQREVDQVYDLLDLTAEQRQQVQSILEAARPESQRLFEENRKLLEPNNRKYFELQEQTRSKIRGILTEEQAKKYDELQEKRRLRRQPRPRPD